MLHLPTREGLLYRWKLYIAYKKDIVAGPVELMVPCSGNHAQFVSAWEVPIEKIN